MQEQQNRPRGPPPPAPVETKTQQPPPRPGSMVFTEAPGNRQDINAARGAMFREQGLETNTLRSVNEPDMKTARSVPLPEPPQPPQQTSQRPEMKGPQNLDVQNILSGLKTRTVDIQQNNDEDSMISIASLKDLQNENAPKRSRRKQKSDRNTISLDI